jgi:hypothetical protein
VFDGATGDELFSRSFPQSASNRIINAALNREGFLVIAFPDRLITLDLLGAAGQQLAEAKIESPNGNPALMNSRPTESIAIGDRSVFVVVDQGLEQPYVRSFDLFTLAPVMIKSEKPPAQEVEHRIDIRPKNARSSYRPGDTVKLKTHAGRLMVMTSKMLSSYSIQQPTLSPWARVEDNQPTLLSQCSPVLVQGGLLIFGWPERNRGGVTTQMDVHLYSRQPTPDGQEEGLLVDEFKLTNKQTPATEAIAVANNAIYYRSIDGVLTMIPTKAK